jgi:3-oxoacyl-[acyl-carrier-protein] synthase III
MTDKKCFISGLAYSVGKIKPIDELAGAENVSVELMNMLKSRGLKHFCEDSRTIPEMCLASTLQTLQSTNLNSSQIAAVVFTSSNSDGLVEDDDETALFAALHSAGFVKTRIIGLTLQACSACGEALQIACDLINHPEKKALVIIFGKKKANRLGPQANTIFSDGAASCIVSAGSGDFEICAIESMINTYLGSMGRALNVAQTHGGLLDLRELSRSVCKKSGVDAKAMRAFFGTNASLGHLNFMAQAAGMPLDKVYQDDVAEFGHLHSCDNLISLKNYLTKHSLNPNDHVMLTAWSSHVVSAAVLKYTGFDSSLRAAS